MAETAPENNPSPDPNKTNNDQQPKEEKGNPPPENNQKQGSETSGSTEDSDNDTFSLNKNETNTNNPNQQPNEPSAELKALHAYWATLFASAAYGLDYITSSNGRDFKLPEGIQIEPLEGSAPGAHEYTQTIFPQPKSSWTFLKRKRNQPVYIPSIDHYLRKVKPYGTNIYVSATQNVDLDTGLSTQIDYVATDKEISVEGLSKCPVTAYRDAAEKMVESALKLWGTDASFEIDGPEEFKKEIQRALMLRKNASPETYGKIKITNENPEYNNGTNNDPLSDPNKIVKFHKGDNEGKTVVYGTNAYKQQVLQQAQTAGEDLTNYSFYGGIEETDPRRKMENEIRDYFNLDESVTDLSTYPILFDIKGQTFQSEPPENFLKLANQDDKIGWIHDQILSTKNGLNDNAPISVKTLNLEMLGALWAYHEIYKGSVLDTSRLDLTGLIDKNTKKAFNESWGNTIKAEKTKLEHRENEYFEVDFKTPGGIGYTANFPKNFSTLSPYDQLREVERYYAEARKKIGNITDPLTASTPNDDIRSALFAREDLGYKAAKSAPNGAQVRYDDLPFKAEYDNLQAINYGSQWQSVINFISKGEEIDPNGNLVAAISRGKIFHNLNQARERYLSVAQFPASGSMDVQVTWAKELLKQTANQDPKASSFSFDGPTSALGAIYCAMNDSNPAIAKQVVLDTGTEGNEKLLEFHKTYCESKGITPSGSNKNVILKEEDKKNVQRTASKPASVKFEFNLH